ncbi:MAG: hemerythrin domain-containing protein [Candidatus Binatia bacterium]
MKATELLKKQHREVKALFRQAKKANPQDRREILDQIEEKLTQHMHIEENVFYPAVRELETKKTEEIVPEAYEEHNVVKMVLAGFPALDPEDERFEAKMTVLDELIQHHVEEEENEMFQAAEKLGDKRLKELGAEMEAMPPAGEEEAPGEGDEAEDDDEDEDDESDEEDDEVEASANQGEDDDAQAIRPTARTTAKGRRGGAAQRGA